MPILTTKPLSLSHDELLDLYRECMRYGIIHYRDDKALPDGDFRSVKLCRLDDKVYLFSLYNGELLNVAEC